MSKGERGGSNPWSGMELDAATFMGAVASEALAIEFAAGDVEAANERLIDEVTAAQRVVTQKKKDLAERQRSLGEHLREISLEGRPIDFESGQALGAADFSGLDERPLLDRKTIGEDLTGSGGVITGFEVGTFLGTPLESPESVVFLVEMDASSEMLCAGVEGYRYGVVAAQTAYNIGQLPQEGDSQ